MTDEIITIPGSWDMSGVSSTRLTGSRSAQGGRVKSSIIVPQDFGAGPDVPFALMYIQLDGAHTAMVNEVERIDLSDIEAAAEELAVGTRLEAVFEPESESEGRITDFHYEPAD